MILALSAKRLSEGNSQTLTTLQFGLQSSMGEGPLILIQPHQLHLYRCTPAKKKQARKRIPPKLNPHPFQSKGKASNLKLSLITVLIAPISTLAKVGKSRLHVFQCLHLVCFHLRCRLLVFTAPEAFLEVFEVETWWSVSKEV